MVCLLRNLPTTVSAPATGFDILPHSSDKSDGAHIARIKYYKNEYVSHSKDGKLSDANFARIWGDLEMVCVCFFQILMIYYSDPNIHLISIQMKNDNISLDF